MISGSGKKSDFGMEEAKKSDDGAPFEKFEGSIFEDWQGLLSVNGTIEGCIKLESQRRKEPMEFVLFEESGYDSCVEDD
jgi:hypothetical protein